MVKSRQVVVVKSGQAADHMISEQIEAAEAAFSKEWDQLLVVYQATLRVFQSQVKYHWVRVTSFLVDCIKETASVGSEHHLN